MHKQAYQFVVTMKKLYPDFFMSNNVLNFGSYDENGSINDLFFNSTIVGIDWREGPGVDVVCLAHEYIHEELVDVCVSTETLEHDPFWKKTLRNMYDNLAVGGALIMTCAGRYRGPHCIGTAPEDNYYMNVLPSDLFSFFEEELLVFDTIVVVENHRGSHDTYLFAIKGNLL